MNKYASSFRLFCKKAARRSFALGAIIVGLLPTALRSREGNCVRVFTYHRFGIDARDPFSISPALFERQMAYLAERNLAISLSELQEFLNGERKIERDSVLISIDDGFRSLYTLAYPILRKYSLPAVAYVTPSLIVNHRSVSTADSGAMPEPYLTWSELAEMVGNGLSVGSHAWTHRSLASLKPREVEEEAVRSRHALERELGQEITSFAYPFGTLADFNDMTTRLLRKSGYTNAFTSQHGAIDTGMDPLRLPRVKVEGGDPMWVFRLLTVGGLDSWRVVDRYLWRLQARKE